MSGYEHDHCAKAEIELQAKLDSALLQNDELKKAISEIGMASVLASTLPYLQKKISDIGDQLLGIMEKPKCEHDWAHIEDHHVICRKCNKTADLCWTCEAEKQNVNGRLVCPKCVEKRVRPTPECEASAYTPGYPCPRCKQVHD